MIQNNSRVLITGGTGFIGSHLVRFLAREGMQIFCLTRQEIFPESQNITYIHCNLSSLNIEEASALKARIGKTDWILYLASSIPAAADKKEDMVTAKKNNLDTFISFLDLFGDVSEKILLTSTIDVYGLPKEKYFRENTPISPLTPYAIAKYCCERYLEFYARINAKLCMILRLSQVYGPNEPLLRVMSFIVDALLQEKEFIINGSGRDRRRFLYVEDAVMAIRLAINQDHGDIFNIAGKENIAVWDAIKMAERVTGKSIRSRQIHGDQKPVDILPCIEKAAIKLGFDPKFDLERGLKNIFMSNGIS